jgi:NNP family nitrate/nitrite transporter-like MFS transporter
LIWLAGLCWLWFNAAAISFSTFAPDFFVSKGSSIGYAGLLASLLMWGSLGLSPIIGRLIDKFNNNDIFIGVGGLTFSISIYLVSKSTNFLFPMAVMAIAVAFVPTPVFSFLSKNLPPKDLGLGFGILGMVSGIGMFFGPYLSGLIKDKTGSYEITFIFLSILALLIPVTAVILRIKIKRAKQ